MGAAFLAAAIPLAGVPDELRNTAVPGAAIAQAYAVADLPSQSDSPPPVPASEG